ncbi:MULTISPECIES: diheme cytochrome c-553 [Sandaracinus]|uniref:diheme cytochrome c-553 n=1 Tax=Sandaracinus TaxID=1055688 RepID=UPI0019D412B8|nr:MULTISPECIES: diheme cytochrome c-553 [Sandaracinus]QRN75818.1 lipoprotein [Sandaracinus sp.]UJR87345.1 Alcohol dehydrogenase cytochrome c subunit [Sandaracinus amylolyticus]
MRVNFLIILALTLTACDETPPELGGAAGHEESGGAPVTAPDAEDRVARGRYIVNAGLCGDCHTPLTMGPSGPIPDASRLLSGHPETIVLSAAPSLPPGPWMAMASDTMTAWSGPWGMTFTANLTPDEETGLGRWNEETFIATIRNGRHMGVGRPLLPPMPFQLIANYSDDDLRAIFAYLQSIPPVRNRVPDPIPPVTAAGAATSDSVDG